jgi:hypothetical protein
VLALCKGIAAEYLEERRAMLTWWADFIDKPVNVVALRKSFDDRERNKLHRHTSQ